MDHNHFKVILGVPFYCNFWSSCTHYVMCLIHGCTIRDHTLSYSSPSPGEDENIFSKV